MARGSKGFGGRSARTGVQGATLKPPTMHIPMTRRDYAKPEIGSENPLTSMASGSKPPTPSFGQTGLTGET